MSRRTVAIALLVALGAVGAGAAATERGAGASADEDRITLTIGVIQDLDTPNVTAGLLASSHELWNLQYATLTDKAAADFALTPGLAESWEASDDGLSYTYTLREGLLWSDGEPLTAEDIAYTVNRSRDEGWVNHSATTAELDAVAVDDRTVTISSSVPDPKLPGMDVSIVPKHIWEPLSAEDVTTYDALDGVGSGPYTLTEWQPGQSWTMVANPDHWQGEPMIDEVVFSVFIEPEEMVAALERGEIDAAHDVPSSAFEGLSQTGGIEAIIGSLGGFTALAMNGMAGGVGDGHPALLDPNVRHAIHHAIDKDVLLDRVALGLGEKGVTLSVSPDPEWQPDIPEADQYDYDPAAANKLLDDGGYADTDLDGIRETPDGGQPLVFRYAERSESENDAALRELITGWLQAVGIGTEVSVYSETQLTDVIASGEYDLFTTRRTPVVDPDTMLSYFTCDNVTEDVDDIGSNDANWCSSEYDELYVQQHTELDRVKRVDLVHQMLTLFYEESTYIVLYEDAILQAYRTDRFKGWLRQPAQTGPVLFTNTSPTYFNLEPVGASDGVDDDGGLGTVALIGIIAGGVAILGVAVWLVLRSRRSRT